MADGRAEIMVERSSESGNGDVDAIGTIAKLAHGGAPVTVGTFQCCRRGVVEKQALLVYGAEDLQVL